MTSITIVTPWHQHPELADGYTAAVLPELRDDDTVLIVDNGGAPNLPFNTLGPQRNLGFGGGSNLGLNLAPTDAVLFLNNDVCLGAPGWLQPLRDALEPGVLAGPIDYRPHARVDGQPYPYVVGWCCAGWRDDLLALGGFDTRLEEPAYYSDNLLSFEARRAGITLVNVPVWLQHLEGTTARDNPEINKVAMRNRELYVNHVRHHAPVANTT
jgi:GT2 family glycosyltransferase